MSQSDANQGNAFKHLDFVVESSQVLLSTDIPRCCEDTRAIAGCA
jgi:hypothetical protein